MRATLIHGAGDIRVAEVPDPGLRASTDAIVRITHACVCGSDLWPYRSAPYSAEGERIGHEFVGVVTETGADVVTVRAGDRVVAPFVWSDGTCSFCREGLHTSCRNGGSWGDPGSDGGQGEEARIPYADGTLVRLPADLDESLVPSLLTLSDVFATGHHAAVSAQAGPGRTVAVVGDGAVGLCGVLAARRLGAERVILLGRHPGRVRLGEEFGATDVVPERGDTAVERVTELTKGEGAHAVLECVGTREAAETALRLARDGGTVGRVGAAQYDDLPVGYRTFRHNVNLAGGWAPARAYIDELLPDVLAGRITPGRVFDRTVTLDGIADGYRAMNERTALKVLVRL